MFLRPTGNIKGEVTVQRLGPENIQKKHISSIIYEPFTIDVGMGMSKAFYEWIRASFDSGHMSKTVEAIACHFDYNVMSIRELQNAHISEVTIPELDGSSKNPAYMTIKLDPEAIRYKPDGSIVQAKVSPAKKKWLTSNFRFELGDLPCGKVSKVDSFTWKQGIIRDEVGMFREATKHPAKVEVPNLKLTISMDDVEQWQQWHRSFIVDCQHEAELTGSITFLGPDLKDELANIELQNVGIIALEIAGDEANMEEVARFVVDLYVERMKFNYETADP